MRTGRLEGMCLDAPKGMGVAGSRGEFVVSCQRFLRQGFAEESLLRALIVETGRSLAPFAEPPDHAQFGTTTVGAAVMSSLIRRGFDVTRLAQHSQAAPSSEPVLVLADHCYVSDKALGDFLALALGNSAIERLALCRTPSSDYTRPVSSVSVERLDGKGPGGRPPKSGKIDGQATERIAYDCFWVPAGKLPAHDDGQSLLAALRERALRRVVPKREIVRELRMPLVGDPAQTVLRYPLTSTVAAHVEHWVHVLWLNHIAFGILWMELIRRRKAWALWRAFTALPPSMPRLMGRFVARGKNVRIHPSALVEGSILGDNVVIGARASVRNSILGDGVEVGDHANVLASSLGARSYVTPKTFFVWSTAYEDAVVSNYKMQMSVLGKGASSSTWAGLIDAKFQGAIDVMHDGALRSTERSFLGSAVGHGAYLGAKVLVLPGRELPNQTFLTMRPDELIREVPRALSPGTPYVRHEGTLVPLEQLLAKRRTEPDGPSAPAAEASRPSETVPC